MAEGSSEPSGLLPARFHRYTSIIRLSSAYLALITVEYIVCYFIYMPWVYYQNDTDHKGYLLPSFWNNVAFLFVFLYSVLCREDEAALLAVQQRDFPLLWTFPVSALGPNYKRTTCIAECVFNCLIISYNIKMYYCKLTN